MNKRSAVYLSLLIVILPFVTILPANATVAPIRVVALDVGAGQSILIMAQEHGILIDTGHAEYTPKIFSRLKAHGAKQLDYLILTHLHPDHAGAYFDIRNAYPKAKLLSNCHPITDSEFMDQAMVRRLHDALGRDPSRRCVKAGDKLSWQGHLLEFLWPHNPEGADLNHHSLVMQITSTKGKKLLIMGDVDRRVENELYKTRQEEWGVEGVDVFIAGHHGAADTGNENFIELIHPKFTIVSVNKNNRNGYPAETTLQVLAKHSSVLYRTDRDGEICIALSEQPRPCGAQRLNN